MSGLHRRITAYQKIPAARCGLRVLKVPKSTQIATRIRREFLNLYPNAKLLVARRKDFETANRKKFCARIATGDYDAVIIGHSQFERIPLSFERQERIIQEQIDETLAAINELKAHAGENFSIKQMEKTRKTLETKLEKLRSDERKDDVITFEQLGVDRLFCSPWECWGKNGGNWYGIISISAMMSTPTYRKNSSESM